MAMMEMAREPEPEQQPRLFITIGNEQPINAEELGRLVRELGADYRRTTGSRLVLARLEQGSTFIEFADQVVIATAYVGAGLIAIEAAERIAQFYNFLKGQLKGSEIVQTALPPPLDASPARLLEIAANSGANLEISRGSGKSKEVIRLSFPEVSMRNADAKERKKRKGQGRLPAPEKPLQIEQLTERLRLQSEADPSQMEGLEVVVEFLKSNNLTGQLPALAKSLEAKNLWTMASIVRRHINKGKGDERVMVRRD